MTHSVEERFVRPVTSMSTSPVDGVALRERLRATVIELLRALLAAPALALLIILVVGIPLSLVGVGLLLVALTVPLAERFASAHRWLAAQQLGSEVPPSYNSTEGRGFLGRVEVWVRDPARWRDLGFLGFACTAGFAMSLAVPALLFVLVGHPFIALATGYPIFLVTSAVGGVLWWVLTPYVARWRSRAEQAILAVSLTTQLERRVEQVSASRTETIDHWSAELRRIERDLHDGAQARIVSLGMNLGLAEALVRRDPDAAAGLLREARETATAALEDLRSVVHGIHPPVLADRGLVGAVEALALHLAIPVTLSTDVDGEIAQPVETAIYFAVAECLANTVKHSGAQRAWVTMRRTGDVLHAEVGDNGHGGADLALGSGLEGVRRRLAAFEGTMTVDSPAGGPTTVRMDVPCALSSPRTLPSSETA